MPHPSGSEFWNRLETLANRHRIVIDRPRGTAHPDYPDLIYPLDYGYLEGTSTIDGDGIDVWLGSGDRTRVTAVICTVDLSKPDAEVKVLLGCTSEEAEVIVRLHNGWLQSGILVTRPA